MSFRTYESFDFLSAHRRCTGQLVEGHSALRPETFHVTADLSHQNFLVLVHRFTKQQPWPISPPSQLPGDDETTQSAAKGRIGKLDSEIFCLQTCSTFDATLLCSGRRNPGAGRRADRKDRRGEPEGPSAQSRPQPGRCRMDIRPASL